MTTVKITKNTNKKMWVVWLALWSAAFSKAMLTGGIAIGDVLFGFAAVVCFLFLCQRLPRIYIPKWSVYVVLLIMWAVVGGLLASGFSPFAFSEMEFLKSFAKLSFYGLGAILLGSYIWKMEMNTIRKAVLCILTINALIALCIYVAQLLEQLSGIHLPHEFFWFGRGGPLTFGERLKPWEIGGIVLNKARGIFSEPAAFGIFQILGLAFLYFRSSTITQKHAWKYIIILVSLLLTFSLSTYILLCTLLVILIFKQRKIAQLFSLLKIMFATVMMIFLLFTLTPLHLSEAFYNRVTHRFVEFVQGQDRSGGVRVLGSWETAKEIIMKSPIFGSGLGNLDVAFNSTGRTLYYSTLVFDHAAIFNIPFYILGTFGIIGFFIFILFVGSLFIRAPAAGTVFLISMFAYGSFLETSFWVFYVLLSINFVSVRKEVLNEKI